MLLFDVNIYVYAHRADSPHHQTTRAFLEEALNGEAPTGHSPQALAGFLRIVTHLRIFITPTDQPTALAFVESILALPHTLLVNPRGKHWKIFSELCRKTGAKGNLIPDAWFAALALEHGATWVSTDGDYTRFPGLTLHNPVLPA